MLFFLWAFTKEEEDLLNRLFSSEHAKMYRIAFGIVHTREAAEEAVQEAFLRIMKYIDRINHLPCPEQVPYCVVIVKNVSRNMMRSQKMTIPVEELEYLSADEDAGPEQAYLKTEDIGGLYQLLQELPEEDRSLLVMRYGQKMTWQQVADMKNISLEAAMKRGQRSIQKMKKMAEKGGVLCE